MARLGTILDSAPRYRYGDKSVLTPMELQCSKLCAMGMMKKVVAQELGVAEKTVERHMTNAYKKLDVQCVIELARTMILMNYLPLADWLNPDFAKWREERADSYP